MKKLTLLFVLVLFLFPYTGFSDEGELKPQRHCPVMGGEINKDVYVDYRGQRIYFCCMSCKSEFSKNPEKYMKKLADDKVLLESVQEKCPVMGGKINKNIFADYKGRRVYFCCESCKETFNKDPEKYIKYLSTGIFGPGM
jgi:YHS domain-containing protein